MVPAVDHSYHVWHDDESDDGRLIASLPHSFIGATRTREDKPTNGTRLGLLSTIAGTDDTRRVARRPRRPVLEELRYVRTSAWRRRPELWANSGRFLSSVTAALLLLQ